MPVSTTIKVVGVKDTINALRKIDPQLQKDFKAQATQIAEPAISAGKAVYTQVPLSGMALQMVKKKVDRALIFRLLSAKAVKAGVRVRFDTTAQCCRCDFD
jgi:hypothetical protein